MKSVYSSPDDYFNELAFAIDAAELGIWDLNPQTQTFKANARLKEWFGLPDTADITLPLAIQVIAEADRPRVEAAIKEALRYESGGQYEIEYTIISPTSGQERVVCAKGKATFGPDGVAIRFNGITQDVTVQHRANQMRRESETYLRQLTDTVPTIIWETRPDGYCTYLNQQWYDTTGQTPAEAEGFGWLDATHPDDKAEAARIFLEANTAQTSFSILYRLRQHDGSYRWSVDKARPRFGPGGVYEGMVGTVVDVHEETVARRQLEAREAELRVSEAKLRSLVQTAPVAIGLFVGRDLVVELPNQTFIDIVGKGSDIEGKPLREVMPELITENQPFLQILDDVYTSGQQFQTYGSQVQIVQHGVMSHNFYNITYTPLFNEVGEVYAILDIAVDVTGQVMAQRKIEETEATLRGAIELAELATWELDIERGIITYSKRFMDWLGFSEATKPLDEANNPLPDEYRQSVPATMEAAWQPGGSGIYENEHPIINSLTGQVRIIHAQAQVRYDTNGKPTYLSGTAQDVTEQRRVQQELERQVAERTQQLAASVQDLERSNQNLQQFAYVASHDLQEPLRKIQAFSSMLAERYGDRLDEGLDLLVRMQNASSRMSVLISDLLTFSRISTRQEATTRVPLMRVFDAVLTDLDFRIEETGAVVAVDELPTVRGDASQLGQLFQNLLGNALKFRKPDTPPHIRVRTQTVGQTDLPASVRPMRQAPTYYRIDVADNGIGFDEQYAERIFQVFQRLHGRSQYAGTGIGLAICEKVAANHGGAITATSQPGQGATFSVYLPVGEM
jgi:PAS domain S-box-containing protein